MKGPPAMPGYWTVVSFYHRNGAALNIRPQEQEQFRFSPGRSERSFSPSPRACCRPTGCQCHARFLSGIRGQHSLHFPPSHPALPKRLPPPWQPDFLSPPTPGPRFTIPSPSHFQGAQVSPSEGKKNHYSFVLFSSFLPFSIQLENLFLIILLLDITCPWLIIQRYIWKGETTDRPLSANHPFFSQGPEWYHFFVYFSRTIIATYVSFTNSSQGCRLLCNAAGFFGSPPGFSGSSLTSPHPQPPHTI